MRVDLGSIPDGFGSNGVIERGKGLFHVGSGGRNGSDDTSLGSSTERVLQESSQLRLPVWDMR